MAELEDKKSLGDKLIEPIAAQDSSNIIENTNEDIALSKGFSKTKRTTKASDFINKPASLFKAKEHQLATFIYDLDDLKQDNLQFCDDCLNPIPDDPKKYKFPLCFDNKDVSEHGIGLTLYFEYIKVIAFICLIGVLSTFSSSLYFRMTEYNDVFNYCSSTIPKNSEIKKLCDEFIALANNVSFPKIHFHNYDYHNKITIALNKINPNIEYVWYDNTFMSFFSVIIILIMAFISYFIFTNIATELDLQNETIEDYSLMIGNIPKTASIEEITNILVVDGIKPTRIIPAYQLHEYEILKQKINKLGYQIKYCQKNELTVYKAFFFSKGESLDSLLTEFNKSCEELEILEHNLTKKSSELTENTFAGEVFAVFNTEDEATTFLEKTKSSGFYKMIRYLFKKNKTLELKNLHVNTASEPTDTIWKNLEFSYGDKNIRSLIIYFLSFVMMAGSFTLLFLISQSQRNLTDSNTKAVVSIIFSLIINIINFVVSKILILVTDYEKPSSYSRYYFSVSLKLTFFTFINTCIIPTVIYFVSARDDPIIALQVFESNLMSIFFINMVYPVYWLLDPFYFITLFFRWRVEKNFESIEAKSSFDDETGKEKYVTSKDYTQEELNQLYQGPDLELFYKYSYIGKTVLMSIMYMNFYPLAPIQSGVGLVFLYFIEKYKIGSKYRKPEQLSADISIFYLFLIKIALIVYSIFRYVLQTYIKDDDNSDLIIMLITIGICLIPYEMFDEKYLVFENFSNAETFDEKYFKFGTNYMIVNPATRERGMIEYLNRLVEKKIITKKEKSEYLKGNMPDVSNVIELYYTKLEEKNNSIKQDKKKKSKFSLLLAKGNLGGYQ